MVILVIFQSIRVDDIDLFFVGRPQRWLVSLLTTPTAVIPLLTFLPIVVFVPLDILFLLYLPDSIEGS